MSRPMPPGSAISVSIAQTEPTSSEHGLANLVGDLTGSAVEEAKATWSCLSCPLRERTFGFGTRFTEGEGIRPVVWQVAALDEQTEQFIVSWWGRSPDLGPRQMTTAWE